MTKILCFCFGALLVFLAYVSLATASVVGLGAALNAVMPTIPLESACIVAGIAVLIGLTLLLTFFVFVRMVGAARMQFEDSDSDEDDDQEFANQIAEIVLERLEPRFRRQQRAKAHRH